MHTPRVNEFNCKDPFLADEINALIDKLGECIATEVLIRVDQRLEGKRIQKKQRDVLRRPEKIIPARAIAEIPAPAQVIAEQPALARESFAFPALDRLIAGQRIAAQKKAQLLPIPEPPEQKQQPGKQTKPAQEIPEYPPKIETKPSLSEVRAEQSSKARLILESIQAARQALQQPSPTSPAVDPVSDEPPTKSKDRKYQMLAGSNGTSTDYVRQIRLKPGRSFK